MRILVEATEWQPFNGGLSQFNRLMCGALAEQGHDVICRVPELDPRDRATAAETGVVLAAHDERLPTAVDLVVGHDRITGPLAVVTQERLPGSLLSVVVHTAPDRLEWLKPHNVDRAIRAGERASTMIELGRRADVVFAVGPQLARHTESLLVGWSNTAPVFRIDPGFDASRIGFGEHQPSPEATCLVFGRGDLDIKGLDIAAHAIGLVNRFRSKSIEQPASLMVRGADPTAADELHNKLYAATEIARSDLMVMPFTVDIEQIRADFHRASMILMPSRSEGFGLSSLEAIAAGVPTLVSARAGLAELITEVAPQHRHRFVVDVHDNLNEDGLEWSNRIRDILDDEPGAIARTSQLRDVLKKHLSWEKVATTMTTAAERIKIGRALSITPNARKLAKSTQPDVEGPRPAATTHPPKTQRRPRP